MFLEFLKSGPGIVSIIMALGLLVVGLREDFRNKKTKTKVLWVLALVLVGSVGISWYQTGVFLGFESLTTAPTDGTGDTNVNVVNTGGTVLNTVDQTTVTLNDLNQFSKGTAVTGNGAHRVFINGADYGYVVDSDSLSVSPGNNLVVYFDENSTGDSTGAYTTKVAQVVGNVGTLLLQGNVCQIDSAPTVTFFDRNGQPQVSGTNNQSMTADTTYTVDWKILATNDKCVGNINSGGQNVMCWKYNNTAFAKISIENLKIDGVLVNANPTIAPTPIAQTTATGESASCYYVPTFSDNQELSGKVIFKTDSTNDPVINLDSPDMYLYDVDYTIDSDTLQEIIGVQDNDNNDIGYTTTSYIVTQEYGIT